MGAGGTQFQSGNQKYKNGDYRGALEDYNQAIRLNQNYAYAYCYRGNCKKKLGYNESALTDYQKALQLSSNNPYFLFCLASISSKMGEQQKAIRYYQRGQKQFNSKSVQNLKSLYLFTPQNIDYIKKCLKQYQSLKKQLDALQKKAHQQKRPEIEKKVTKIQEQLIKKFIGAVNVYKTKQNDKEKDSKLEEFVKEMRLEMQDLKGQLKQKDIKIQELEKKAIKTEQIIFKIDQDVNNFKLDFNKLKSIVKEIQNDIYADKKVLKRIESLDNNRRDYYNALYNTVINHFLAYRIVSTGFFQENTRQLDLFDKITNIFSSIKPIIQMVPVVGDIMTIPFQILNKVKEFKSADLNQVIAKKINNSVIKTEEKISKTMAKVIGQLIDNKDFNAELSDAIQNKNKTFIDKFMDLIESAKQTILSTVFGGETEQQTYARKVAVLHMTQLTIKIYKSQPQDFQNACENEQKFYKFLLDAIYKPNPSVHKPNPSVHKPNPSVHKLSPANNSGNNNLQKSSATIMPTQTAAQKAASQQKQAHTQKQTPRYFGINQVAFYANTYVPACVVVVDGCERQFID